jgi:hypothetical protein
MNVQKKQLETLISDAFIYCAKGELYKILEDNRELKNRNHKLKIQSLS